MGLQPVTYAIQTTAKYKLVRNVMFAHDVPLTTPFEIFHDQSAWRSEVYFIKLRDISFFNENISSINFSIRIQYGFKIHDCTSMFLLAVFYVCTNINYSSVNAKCFPHVVSQ